MSDDIKKYGNKNEIDKPASSTLRGERLSKKDKNIISEPRHPAVNFGEFNENKMGDDQFIELHVYDENGIKLDSIYNKHKLNWSIQKAAGDTTTGNQLVFRPGDDLRASGYDFGGFKLVYNVFEELLGSRDGNKVYIQEISPSRKEIRVLPVPRYPKATEDKHTRPFIGSAQYPQIDDKEKSLRLNHIFSNKQWENRLELQKYNLLDRRFIHDFSEFSEGKDSDTWVYKKGKIYTAADSNEEIVLDGGKFTKAMEGGLVRVYDVNDKNRIIYQTRIKKIKSGGRRATVTESYKVNTQNTKLPKMGYEIQYVRSQEVKKDDLKNLAVFGDNRNLLVTNWELDDMTFDEYPFSAVIRLYEPLPSDIQLKSTFFLVRELLPPIIENVVLESDYFDIEGTHLRPPDFNVDDKYLTDTSRATQFETWEELLGGDPKTSERVVDSMVNYQSGSIDIHIDYTKFENFINFSSAEERLKNFKYKLDLIEGYDEKVNELFALSGSVIELDKTKGLIRKIKRDFDSWERYMYDESGSKAIPKSYLTKKPYVNYATTSSEFINWYGEHLLSSSMYDKDNYSMLRNNLPAHIREDEYNSEFNLFFDMAGQHFDTLWTYIKSMTDQNQHINSLTEGISKDLIPDIIKNIGFNLQNGTDARRLWRHYLGMGTTSSGSLDGEGTGGASVGETINSNDYTKEIWKRILANMPYILKTKGTARSIKALISCYGIPSTILDIREYGGPSPVVDESVYYYNDEFSYALDLNNSGYISSSWSPLLPTNRQADTIQIRHEGTLTKEGNTHQRQMILEASSSYTQWGITAKNNGSSTDSKGYYTFFISSSGTDFGSDPGLLEISSSELNIFDGRYRSIMLTRAKTGSLSILDNDNRNQDITYTLSVGEYDNEFQKVVRVDTSYLHLSGSALTDHDNRNEAFSQSADLFIGGAPVSTLGIQMSGSVQEFRLWHGEVLTEKTFRNHVSAPRSYQGNKYTSAKKYNTIRYSFNQRKQHDLETYYTESNGKVLSNRQIIDQSINTSQDTHGWAVGFQSKSGQSNPYHYLSEVSQHKYAVPALGSNVPAEKIRNINNTLDFGNLHVKKSVEKSTTEYAPTDSPRIGVYFSPTNLIDIDIIREYGGEHLATAMGDPMDAYYGKYRDLNALRREYFLKYNGVNAIYEYIKLIDYYDRSLFDTIKKFLPARAAANVGLSIEPSLLERNRHQLKPIQVEENNFEGKVDIENYIARDDVEDGFGMTYGGDEGYEEGGLAMPSQNTFGGEMSQLEDGIEQPLTLEGEEHSEEGTIGVTPELIGEEHSEEGSIDPDSWWNFTGEDKSYEGIIGVTKHGFVGIDGTNVKADASIHFIQTASDGATITLDSNDETITYYAVSSSQNGSFNVELSTAPTASFIFTGPAEVSVSESVSSSLDGSPSVISKHYQNSGVSLTLSSFDGNDTKTVTYEASSSVFTNGIFSSDSSSILFMSSSTAVGVADNFIAAVTSSIGHDWRNHTGSLLIPSRSIEGTSATVHLTQHSASGIDGHSRIRFHGFETSSIGYNSSSVILHNSKFGGGVSIIQFSTGSGYFDVTGGGETANNLATAINSFRGHNGSITAYTGSSTSISSSVYLEQNYFGEGGNTHIFYNSSFLSSVNYSPDRFTGGDEEKNYNLSYRDVLSNPVIMPGGETRNYEGLIGNDETKPITPGGESRNYEGIIGEEPGDKPIIPSGESRNYEGLIGSDESLIIELGGRSPNYEGLIGTDESLIIELGGRSANYEGLIGTDETELIEFDGESRNYDGLIGTDELPQITLGGSSNNYEATVGYRENKFQGTAVEPRHAKAQINFNQSSSLSGSITLTSVDGTTKVYTARDHDWSTPFLYWNFDSGSAQDFDLDGVFSGTRSSAELIDNADFVYYEGDETASIDFGDWTESQGSGDAWYSTGSDGRTIRMETRIVPTDVWHHRIRQNVSSKLKVGGIYEYRFKTRGSYPKWTIRISNAGGTHNQEQAPGTYFGDRHGTLSGPTESFADHRFVFQCTYATNQWIDIFPNTGGASAPLQAGDFLEVKDISLKELSPLSGSGDIETTQGSMGDPSSYHIANSAGLPKIGYESVTGKGSVYFHSSSTDELKVPDPNNALDSVVQSGSNFTLAAWVKRHIPFKSGSSNIGGDNYDPGYILDNKGNDGNRDRFNIIGKGTYNNSFGISYEFDNERFVAGGRDQVNSESMCYASVADGLSGSFSHVAVTYESGSQSGIKLYVNGVLRDDAPWQSTALQNKFGDNPISGSEHDFRTTDTLKIGGNDIIGGNNTYFQGYIDDPKIYYKALSANEIRGIYKNPGSLDGNVSGSVVWFNSGSDGGAGQASGSARSAAGNLAAAITGSNGHQGKLSVGLGGDGGNILTVSQTSTGLKGHTDILYNDHITGSLVYPLAASFTGGEETVARNIEYAPVIQDLTVAYLSGESTTYEGTMMSGMRENRDYPINEKGTGAGRWTPWLLEQWQKESGSYYRSGYKEGDTEYNLAHLHRRKETFKKGETFPMYSKKSVRPDYFYTSSKGSHSSFVTEHSYRQVQYESGSGTLVTQKVKGGKVLTQGRAIKYYEPAQFTPFTSTADLNNRFEGCKITSMGKDGKSLQQITPQDWMELDNSRDTVDGLPVVEVNDTTPTQLFVSEPPSGQSDLEGY